MNFSGNLKMTMKSLTLTLVLGCAVSLVPRGTQWAPARRGAVLAAPHMSLSGRVLPATYKSCASLLAIRAVMTPVIMEKGILGAAAALSVLDFAPRASAGFASAKAACAFSVPPSASALRWRLAVRVKTLGQILGLSWMALGDNMFFGAAATFAAKLSFWALGGGSSSHDDDGAAAPLSDEVVSGKATEDATLLGASVIAAVSPRSPIWWLNSGLVFSGMLFGLIEPARGALETQMNTMVEQRAAQAEGQAGGPFGSIGGSLAS